MFHYRPKKMTITSLLKDFNDYRVLKRFHTIFNQYINDYKELDNFQLISHNSILNIIRRRCNRISLNKKSLDTSHFFVLNDDMRNHIMQIGTTGRGKNNLNNTVNQHASALISNKIESNLMIKNIDKYEIDGFKTLSVIMTNDYEILIQYKENKLFIYIYFSCPDYFVQLNYKGKKLSKVYSSFNQTIDIISNNIAFLLTIEKFNNDFNDILEQDISAEDKITLANMLNI